MAPSDRDLERLFAGLVAPGDPELGRLSAFARRLRAACEIPPPPQVRARHLEAVRAALRDTPAPSLTPSRSRLVRSIAAAAAGALAVAGSALAATGSLPTPAQDVVAGLARHVGVKLPRPRAVFSRAPRSTPAPTRNEPFTDAKKAWTRCVAARGGEGRAGAREACGPGPTLTPPLHPTPTATPTSPEPTEHPEKTPEAARIQGSERGQKTDHGQGDAGTPGPRPTPQGEGPEHSSKAGD